MGGRGKGSEVKKDIVVGREKGTYIEDVGWWVHLVVVASSAHASCAACDACVRHARSLPHAHHPFKQHHRSSG